jgi:hypothetical protein
LPCPGRGGIARVTCRARILLENYFLPGDLEAQIEALHCHLAVSEVDGRKNTLVVPIVAGCSPSKAPLPQYRCPARLLVKARKAAAISSIFAFKAAQSTGGCTPHLVIITSNVFHQIGEAYVVIEQAAELAGFEA